MIHRLEKFINSIPLEGALSEWGAPPGQMGRLIPSLVVKKMAIPCLWVRDYDQMLFYPAYWNSLGHSLEHMYFLHDKDPLQNLRVPFRQSKFRLLVLDLERFVSPADMNYLAKYCRQNQVTCMLLRKYFLSAKNGNPFCQHRINCSYSLQDDLLRVNLIKGRSTPSLKLSLDEVFNG